MKRAALATQRPGIVWILREEILSAGGENGKRCSQRSCLLSGHTADEK